jgi:hypothetical protein
MFSQKLAQRQTQGSNACVEKRMLHKATPLPLDLYTAVLALIADAM